MADSSGLVVDLQNMLEQRTEQERASARAQDGHGDDEDEDEDEEDVADPTTESAAIDVRRSHQFGSRIGHA